MLSADKLGNSFNAKRQRIRGNIPKTMSGFLIVLFFCQEVIVQMVFFLLLKSYGTIVSVYKSYVTTWWQRDGWCTVVC